MGELARRCARVQARLPLYVDQDLSWWRRRLVDRHLRRCDDCAAAAARQRHVTAELVALAEQEDAALEQEAPPEDLLATLLEQARDPGLRGRVAVPARGAVSGARPGLSVALVATVLALVALAGWAGWQIGRARRR